MGQGLRILIVEDVPEMLEYLRQLFSAEFADVASIRTARNTLEARQELLRHRPDLVLLDEILPGESSSELLNEAAREGIPTLLITEIENPVHGMPKPALGRLPKPNPRNLKRVLPLYLDYFARIKKSG